MLLELTTIVKTCLWTQTWFDKIVLTSSLNHVYPDFTWISENMLTFKKLPNMKI